LFGLSSLSQFIYESLPSPKNIGEAIDFLSKPSCEYFSNIFDQSLSIVLNHFAEIRIDQFLRLSNSVLEKLLQSPQLQFENEDFLFNLVVELIRRDSNRKILLKYLFFPGMLSSLLLPFFRDFSVEEIDPDLFESLKIRLLCNTFLLDSFPSSRWQNSPRFLSKNEMDENLELLHDHFQQSANLFQ
jgi:hypothetical protein